MAKTGTFYFGISRRSWTHDLTVFLDTFFLGQLGTLKKMSESTLDAILPGFESCASQVQGSWQDQSSSYIMGLSGKTS